MAVKFTTDQFQALTQFKLDQIWPERSKRARMEVTMTSDQLQAIVAALQMRHRMDIEATKEGETLHKQDQVDQVNIEATREGETLPKRDQVDIEATREGEALPKLDQVDQMDIEATREGEA